MKFTFKMALQTNTIVNGAWTRQTVGMDDILRHYNGQDIQEAAVETEKIPLLGLLSQTVIRSPLAHWILPVRLRDSRSNDVAFIGVSSVFSYFYTNWWYNYTDITTSSGETNIQLCNYLHCYT